MKASKLIEYLKDIISTNGDIEVGASTSHDYWGCIDHKITESDFRVRGTTSFDWPKRDDTGPAIIIELP